MEVQLTVYFSCAIVDYRKDGSSVSKSSNTANRNPLNQLCNACPETLVAYYSWISVSAEIDIKKSNKTSCSCCPRICDCELDCGLVSIRFFEQLT